jgi:hypothetical protein
LATLHLKAEHSAQAEALAASLRAAYTLAANTGIAPVKADLILAVIM